MSAITIEVPFSSDLAIANVKLEDLQQEVRKRIARFTAEVTAAVDMGHTDISGATEVFLLELFREVYALPNLQNLNERRPNFPGLDLGDDVTGTAFQITASRDLNKVVECLTTVVREGLHETYPHVKIFVATRKQRTYKQDTIDAAADGKLAFDAKRDVIDSSDLLKYFKTFDLDRLERVAVILRKHFPPEASLSMARAVGQALERDLEHQYRQAIRRSTFPESATADQFAELAEAAMDEGASQVSSALRRRILLRAARSAALRGQVETAARLVTAAVGLEGPDSDIPARARIDVARGEVDRAIRLLRDQPDADSVSTLVSVLVRSQGDVAALAWFAGRAISIAGLTSHGVITLVQVHWRLDRFDEARRVLEQLIDMQVSESPYLLLLRGVFLLASIFSEADQRQISAGAPLHLGSTKPVLQEVDIIVRIDAALADLHRLLPILQELNLPQTNRAADAYILWCELLHPHRHAQALVRLRRDMMEPTKAIHCLQFAFAFDPTFDPQPVEAWLDKRAALGGLSDDELRASLVIRMHHGDPARVAQIIADHRQRFQQRLGEALILSIEVQALAAAKDAISAKAVLEAGKAILDVAAVLRLEAEIAKAEGADPVVEHLRVYEATGTIEALRSLVNVLMDRADHRALGKYVELLYQKTRDPHDIERAAHAFANARDDENFVRIMETHPFLHEKSPYLKRGYGWQLFRRGRLSQARQIAADLRDGGFAQRDLNLEIALAVESGQWEMLAAPLAAYLDESIQRDGTSLIRAAHLAHTAGHGPFQHLIEAAVHASPDDAQVLLGAYTLAMASDLEDTKPEAHEWFRRALELSGPDGPVQQFELKELLARQAEWSARSRSIDEAIIRGDMPLIIGAPALGANVVEAILGNFLRNSELLDPRQRSVVPTFSGRRAPARMMDVKRVALDISATLVLGWLDLLPKVLESFDRVLIPAGLLRDLFEGMQRARQAQRSRLVRARRIQAMLGHGLHKLEPGIGVAHDLVEEVGTELATLIEAARASNGVVIRPAPVHRPGLSETRDADMLAYEPQLADMHSLLEALKAAGAVDQQTEQLAQRYFRAQDAGWPNAARLQRTQPIYLDSLSISYLHTTDLLDALVRTFDKIYVHASVQEEATAMVDAERRADGLSRIVDAIRRAIGHADAAGRIVFGPRSARAETDELHESSTLHLLSDLGDVEAVIVDDRALNKEVVAIDGKDRHARTFTSLDVIEELHARGTISSEERLIFRHRLRVAGAALVSVDAEDILNAAERSTSQESAEHRGIRESIGLALIRRAVRFPGEVPWFIALTVATKEAIMEVWKRSSDAERARALADAILQLRPNVIEWMSCWEGVPPPQWVEVVIRYMTASLMLPVELNRAALRKDYHEWLDRRILAPMRTLEPERYQGVIEYVRTLMISIARSDDE